VVLWFVVAGVRFCLLWFENANSRQFCLGFLFFPFCLSVVLPSCFVLFGCVLLLVSFPQCFTFDCGFVVGHLISLVCLGVVA